MEESISLAEFIAKHPEMNEDCIQHIDPSFASPL